MMSKGGYRKKYKVTKNKQCNTAVHDTYMSLWPHNPQVLIINQNTKYGRINFFFLKISYGKKKHLKYAVPS